MCHLLNAQVTVYDLCARSSHENTVKCTDVLCGIPRDYVRSLEVCITSMCHERSLGMEKVCMIVLLKVLCKDLEGRGVSL